MPKCAKALVKSNSIGSPTGAVAAVILGEFRATIGGGEPEGSGVVAAFFLLDDDGDDAMPPPPPLLLCTKAEPARIKKNLDSTSPSFTIVCPAWNATCKYAHTHVMGLGSNACVKELGQDEAVRR